MFHNNENAVIGMPIYLIVALVVTAIILAIFLFSVQYLIRDAQVHSAQSTIQRIVDEAETMFEHADEGTMVTLHVEFPSSLRFVVFGGLPEGDTSPPQDLILNETTSNNYYYVMEDNSVFTGHSIARFSSHNTSEIAVFQTGVYDLTLELIQNAGRTYVTISE
ncbi:MAG: hypothetical protein V1726_04065 [Methanobacteriota archaeon]